MIQLAISRKREYLADASGALLTRYPEGLASALEKINASHTPMRRASHATAHLFISDPFKTRKAWFQAKAIRFVSNTSTCRRSHSNPATDGYINNTKTLCNQHFLNQKVS
jgi:Zn-dependent protease with chaperone function